MKSQTNAIKTASAYVSDPCGSYTSWQVVGPYYSNQLDGPTTTVSADSYKKALGVRTKWVAYIALRLLGHPDTEYEVDRLYDDGVQSARSIVAIIMRGAK